MIFVAEEESETPARRSNVAPKKQDMSRFIYDSLCCYILVERKVKNRTTAKTSYVIHFSTKEDFSKNAQTALSQRPGRFL